MKKFKKFSSKYPRKNRGESSRSYSRRSKDKEKRLSYKYRKSGHFVADCLHPRVRKHYDDEKVSKSAERQKPKKSLKARKEESSTSESATMSYSGEECLVAMEVDEETLFTGNSKCTACVCW